MSPDHPQATVSFPVRARSAWQVVVLPTSTFLGIWIGVPVLAHALGASGTGAVLGAAGVGLVLALVASVGLHRAVGQGSGKEVWVSVSDGGIRWGRHALRLDAPHRAVLRLDAHAPSPAASLELQGGRRSLTFFARPVDPAAVTRAFPAEGFALEGALGPDQGLPGWVVPEGALAKVLAEAWRHRDQNRVYQLHARLPWGRPVSRAGEGARTMPFAAPEVQAEVAQALCVLKPEEIWLTPAALVLREGTQARIFPLGSHRVEPVAMGDTMLRWYRIGDASFWLDPGDGAAEVELALRFVNSRRMSP